MTDNQIIEELQDEVDYARVYNLWFIDSVSAGLLAEALALINRQKTELKKAQKAIEKQTPKKPLDVHTPVVTWGVCPRCKGKLNKLGGRPYRIFIGTRYCSDCGQALDWTESEQK